MNCNWQKGICLKRSMWKLVQPTVKTETVGEQGGAKRTGEPPEAPDEPAAKRIRSQLQADAPIFQPVSQQPAPAVAADIGWH